jgi:DNA-binding transcriptional regulator of glucitol operon
MIMKILDNPKLMRRITATLIFLSIIEWVAATIFGWVNLVSYVSHLSQLAITISLIPRWQGLRVESRQVEEDIPGAIKKVLVEETTIEEA